MYGLLDISGITWEQPNWLPRVRKGILRDNFNKRLISMYGCKSKLWINTRVQTIEYTMVIMMGKNL